MKLAVSSDWHGLAPKKSDKDLILGCDALLLAGDVLENKQGYEWKALDELAEFLVCLKDYGIPVIMTPGNHDFHIYNDWIKDRANFEFVSGIDERLHYGRNQNPYSKEFLEEFLGIKVLIDEPYILNGVKIYGTPWSPEFCNWAFMLKDENLEEKFQKIPMDADILLAHSPPLIDFRRIDVVEGRSDHCGSKSLERVLKERPNLKYGFFGHIHTGDHTPMKIGNTVLQNVSYLNEGYSPRYPIKILEI